MRDEVSDTMRRASRRVRADLASIQRAARGVGRTLRSVGRAITSDFGVGVARVLALAGAAAGKLHLDFQKALTPIVTLVGIARSQVQEWRADILRLAGETARAPRELAEAMFVVTSAGARGSTALEILTAAARASAVGLGRTADIARSVVSAVTAYGEKVLTAAMATDVLTATVRAGNLEATELASRLGIVLPLASQLGVTFQEVGAFIATYTRLGVPVAVATTGLRGLLAAIIEPSDDARKAYAELGLTIDQVKDSIKSDGLQSVFANLIELSGGNVEVLGRLIPRVEGLTALLGTAAAQGETYAGVLDDINQSAGLAGDTFEQTAEEDWFKFEQAVNDAKIGLQGFGEVLAPVIQGFLGLPTPIQHAVFAMAALQVMSTLHLAPSLASLSGMLTTVATRALPLLAAAVATSSAVIVPAATAMWAALTGPIGLAIIALIAIGTAVYIFRDEIVGALSSVWNWVEDHWMDIGSILLLGLTGPLGLLLTNTFGLRDALIDAFESVVSFIGDFAGSAFSAAKDFGESVADGIMEGLDSLVSRVVDTGKGVANALIGMVNSGITVINDAIPDRIQIPGPLPDINLPNNPIPTIPMLQRGTDRFAGGSAIVGEDGPELVNVPAGSSVINAGDIRNLTNAVRSASAGGIGAAGSLGPAASVSPAADGQEPRLIRSQRRLSDSLDDLTETLDKRVVPIEREVARGLTEFDEAWLTQQDPGLAAARRNAWVEGLSGGLGGGGGGGGAGRAFGSGATGGDGVFKRLADVLDNATRQQARDRSGVLRVDDEGEEILETPMQARRRELAEYRSRNARQANQLFARGDITADYGSGRVGQFVSASRNAAQRSVREFGEAQEERDRNARRSELMRTSDLQPFFAGAGQRAQDALMGRARARGGVLAGRETSMVAATPSTPGLFGSMAIPQGMSIEDRREAWLAGTYTPKRSADGAHITRVPSFQAPTADLFSGLGGQSQGLFPATGTGGLADEMEDLQKTLRKRIDPRLDDMSHWLEESTKVERKFSLDPYVGLRGIADASDSGARGQLSEAFETARESVEQWLTGSAEANPMDVMFAFGVTLSHGDEAGDSADALLVFQSARDAMSSYLNDDGLANPMDLMQAFGVTATDHDEAADRASAFVTFRERHDAVESWLNDDGLTNPMDLMQAFGVTATSHDEAADRASAFITFRERRDAMSSYLNADGLANPFDVMQAFGVTATSHDEAADRASAFITFRARRDAMSSYLNADGLANPIDVMQAFGVTATSHDAAADRTKALLTFRARRNAMSSYLNADGLANPIQVMQAMAVTIHRTVTTITSHVNETAPPPTDPPPGELPEELAMGGIVTRPTLATIGEAGPEAVIPLADFESMMGGGQPIMIHNVIELDGEKVGENVAEHMLGDALSSSGFSLQQ